jgi:hypothetical protein
MKRDEQENTKSKFCHSAKKGFYPGKQLFYKLIIIPLGTSNLRFKPLDHTTNAIEEVRF